jgi:ribosomal protein S27AE
METKGTNWLDGEAFQKTKQCPYCNAFVKLDEGQKHPRCGRCRIYFEMVGDWLVVAEYDKLENIPTI